jgi:hypothetical protein
VLGLVSTGVLIFYRIDRSSHERNLETLEQATALAESAGAGELGGISPR